MDILGFRQFPLVERNRHRQQNHRLRAILEFRSNAPRGMHIDYRRRSVVFSMVSPGLLYKAVAQAAGKIQPMNQACGHSSQAVF